MKRYCLALDLVDDDALIAEYEAYHQRVWPEILDSIHQLGIGVMEIWRFSNRLFMIMEVDDTFTFAAKDAADAANPKVQEWETLMLKYQRTIPGTKPGQKWVMMDKIFQSER
jgi:L-rhamnose mutarotase